MKPPYATVRPDPTVKYKAKACMFTEATNDYRMKWTLRYINCIQSDRWIFADTLKQFGEARAGKPSISVPCTFIYRTTRVISLCQWDRTLSHKDQLYMKSSWDTVGVWRKGYRKMRSEEMPGEFAFRKKVGFCSKSEIYALIAF